jgi:diadenosine tetraphosphatase ApaH/serine/threonine PP2A family protein phosphatase
MEKIFQLVDRVCFQGHTHVPGVFTDDLKFKAPPDFDMEYRLDGKKTLVNVGSVGQPRDFDPRACYILYDGETIKYRRVPYDLDATIRKIHSIPSLDRFLGDRLREGR